LVYDGLFIYSYNGLNNKHLRVICLWPTVLKEKTLPPVLKVYTSLSVEPITTEASLLQYNSILMCQHVSLNWQ